mmetsp:Transcript_29206/g.38416  ORF Transcript_29206/g.38416 Transcript_29206/m.38416 type:complete len:539 (+) Transcript_29206:78-1694(+)
MEQPPVPPAVDEPSEVAPLPPSEELNPNQVTLPAGEEVRNSTASSNADRDKFDIAVNSTGGAKVAEGDDKMAVFEKWLLENGSKYPQLEMREYDEEVRGVHAKEDISPDVNIVEIPLCCLITVEMGKQTEVGQAVLAANLDLDAPKHVFLMLYMLIDRKDPNSFFKPYYDILPPTLSNMPIFWSEEELRWLDGSYLQTQIEDRKFAIENDYSSICELCPNFANIATLDDFKWARMCVCSRNFGLVINGTRTSAMVPLADMLNHYRPRETKWTFDNKLQAFTITTLMNITGDAQVYDSYGQKCNHRFLLNYGFSIENNVEPDGFCPNEVPIEFKLNPNDPIFERKATFWRADSGPMIKRIRVCVSDNENTRVAFSFLRVMVATPEEFELMEGNSRFIYRTAKDIRFPFGLRNERAALEVLASICEEYLSKYPTTLEEDKTLLASGDLKPFSNHRHAVIQIIGEKNVLHHYLELARLALGIIDRNDPLNDEQQSELYATKHQHMVDYCVNVVGQIRRHEQAKAKALASPVRQMSAGPTII